MRIVKEIHGRKKEFLDLCRQHQVKSLYAFGSSVTDYFDEKRSDIDLLVEIDEADPIERGGLLMDFWDQMEVFFGRKVDLLTDSSIRNPILRQSIDKKMVLLFNEDMEWLEAASRNPAFDFLKDPAEDVYSLKNGSLLREQDEK
ncbi:nucleotidyltransferase domain-containing protein [Litoribacter ruber]|uniref:Nucleotidyltransferase domain-containing protein n=1 Tax=Litoribacter ruber TaxID=702568 RepID=A0AAP2CHX0_9BACT|nr:MULTISPECIES: nucleotidyltransferase domain-containing protein [Litoribacter]MBS9525016.1 nucleotidyltransferase domain-containing protein [Litoribacter alkaliphilus]MBT0811825.1 nucleotidyltransferase domain-containing protein [Litoribacter ruber]